MKSGVRLDVFLQTSGVSEAQKRVSHLLGTMVMLDGSGRALPLQAVEDIEIMAETVEA